MQMKNFLLPVLFSLMVIAPQLATARGNTETTGNAHEISAVKNPSQHEHEIKASASQNTSESSGVFYSLSDFPNLHPLVVHFPVVLLVLSFFSQLIGLFIYRKEFSWLTMFLLLGGFFGALLAGMVFHPDVDGIPEKAARILEAHDTYASWTMWLSGIALGLKIISHFFLKRKTWIEILVMLVITGSAVTVTLTGHLGAEMVYIEDVGPEGHGLK